MDVDRHLAGVLLGIVQPHVILPSQHFKLVEKFAPERRLMIAVLDDAIRCVEKYRRPIDARGRRIYCEAEQWLLADEPNWPYSFERICAVLDLDANAVRYRLLSTPARQPASVSWEIPIATHDRAIASATDVESASGSRSRTLPRSPSRTYPSRREAGITDGATQSGTVATGIQRLEAVQMESARRVRPVQDHLHPAD